MGAWRGGSLMVYVLSVLNSGSVLDVVHTDGEIQCKLRASLCVRQTHKRYD